MLFKQWLHSSTIRLALIAVVLCMTMLIGTRSTGQVKAAALQPILQDTTSDLQANNPSATLIDLTCTVMQAGVHVSGSTLVSCATGIGGINWWSVPSTNSADANRALTVALAAQAIGRKVWIGYDPNDTALPPGCLVVNCRKLIWIHTSNEPAN